jgi:hypothetical protein
MITAMFKLVGRSFGLSWAVLLVPAGVWALWPSTPSWSSLATDSLSRYFNVWTGRGCERNKEVCLTTKLAELDALHAELARVINALADRKGQIVRDLANRERDLTGNTGLLEEGRQLYGRSVEFKGTVRFDGREYPPDALKRRLEGLYRLGHSLQASVKQARALDEAVDRKLNDLLIKKANVRATRDLLPSHIELVRANMIIGDVDATLRDVTKLSDAVRSTVAEVKNVGAWLADTNKLIKRQVDADWSGQQPDFGSWINVGRVVPDTAVRQEAQ